jgi:antitoxin (DNA-binding transcriptional repressor) of toxin-antitoxin stability system
MEVSITQFRRDLFDLANRALNGETITVSHKGRRFRIVPEIQPSTRFDRVTPLQVINPEYPDLDDKAIKEEMQAAWERDWAEQGLG